MTGLDEGERDGTVSRNERSGGLRVLYPVLRSETDEALVVAVSVARALDAELVVGHVDVGGDDASSDVSRDVAQTVLDLRTVSDEGVSVEGRSLTGSSPLDAVLDAVETDDVDAVVFGDDASERLESRLASRVDCDTLVVNDGTKPEAVASILVPVAGGPHSGAAVDAAAAIARANDAWIELIHVVDPDEVGDATAHGDAILERRRPRASAGEDVDARVVEGESVADAIVDESAYHDLTVIGAPQSGRLRRMIFGSTSEDVREQARGTVVMVRDGSSGDATVFSDPSE